MLHVVCVYLCLCGALLLGVSVKPIRRGDKIASIALEAGLILAIIGTLPFLILYGHYVCFIFTGCSGDPPGNDSYFSAGDDEA